MLSRSVAKVLSGPSCNLSKAQVPGFFLQIKNLQSGDWRTLWNMARGWVWGVSCVDWCWGLWHLMALFVKKCDVRLFWQVLECIILIYNVTRHTSFVVLYWKLLQNLRMKRNTQKRLKGLLRRSSFFAVSAHLKAAGRSGFKMQAPGWTVAILPLALSMLASDSGSSAGAQPSIEEEERGVTYFHFALGHF